MTPADRPLCRCTKFGREFANRNQSYGCGTYDLAHHLESPRFGRIDTISRRNHVHVFRITRPEEIDVEFRGWLAEAYAVGKQEHLSSSKRT